MNSRKVRNDRLRQMIRAEVRRLVQTGLLTPFGARRSLARRCRAMRMTWTPG